MVKFQLALLLRAMSGSIAMQWQGLVLISLTHVTIRDHGDVPGISCQGLSRTGPDPHLDNTTELVLVVVAGTSLPPAGKSTGVGALPLPREVCSPSLNGIRHHGLGTQLAVPEAAVFWKTPLLLYKPKSWTCSLQAATPSRVSPAFYLGCREELALVGRAQVSQPHG